MNRLKKGMAGSFFVAVFLSMLVFLMIFSIAIFRNNLNSILHNLQTELYMIGRNSLFAIERDLMAQDIYSIYEDDIEKFIKKEMMVAWNLDEELMNGQKIIYKAEIIELKVMNKGEFDPVLNEKVKNMTIHMLVEVHVKPIILKSVFEENMIFKLHEDIRIEKLIES